MFGLPTGEGNSWFGQLFVMACYGFILYKAAVLIGDGSEKLLLIYGPGIVGGLLIPILGAIPDGAIVLVSGLGDNAQCQVSTGVGTLAGSTIMLLTIPWAFSLFVGCRDRDPITGRAASKANGRPKYKDGFKPCSSCVTTYPNTVSGAKIMIMTSISYLIVLIPAIVEKNASAQEQIESEHYPALVGFIVCAVAFVAYSIFQLVDSRAQTTQELKQQKLRFLKWQASVGRKIASTDVAIKMAFEKFDKDGNGTIDRAELHAGFKELGLELDRSEVVSLMAVNQQDDDDRNTLDLNEFSDAVKQWSRAILKRQITDYDGAMAHSKLHQVHELQSMRRRQAVITVDESVSKSSAAGDDDQEPLKKDKRQHPTYHSVQKHEEKTNLIPRAKSAHTPLGAADGRASEREELLDSMWQELLMSVKKEDDDDDEEEEEEELHLHLSDTQLKLR
eukprot:128080_1